MSLIPSIRSLASKCSACRSKLVTAIFLLSEIMPACSRYAEKGLIYIIIIALSSRQPSLYTECTKLNMRALYNI